MTNFALVNSNQSTIAQVLNSRVMYVLAFSHMPSSLDLGDIPAFLWRRTGHIYYRLDSGNTQPVDGTRVIADRNGTKFAISNDDMPKAWLNVFRSAPTNPTAGDTYRVDGLATGTWATRRNTIARWNAELQDWIYYGTEAGDMGLNRASRAIEFHDGVTWQASLGAENIGKGEINPLQLSDPGYITVKGYQNAPPTVPAVNGDLYIVRNGTGEWVGQNHKIARKISTGWDFSDAEVGTVMKSPTERRTFNGTSWTIVGTEVALVGYKKQTMPIADIVPTGEVAPSTNQSQSRTLWSFTADSNVTHLDIRTSNIDITIQASDRVTRSLARAGLDMQLEFVIAVGGTAVTTVGPNTYNVSEAGRFIGGRVYPWRANEKREVDMITPDIPFTEIDFSEYSSRVVTFEMRIPTYLPGSDGVLRNPFAFKDIRDVTKADGHSTIRSYVETLIGADDTNN